MGDAPIPALRPDHLYKAVGLLFLFLILYSHFAAVSRVRLLVFAAAILAVALNVVVGLLPRHRRLMSGGIGFLLFGGLALTLWLAIPALAGQVRGVVTELPRLEAEVERLNEHLRVATGLQIDLVGDQARSFVGRTFQDAEFLGAAWGIVEGIFLPLVILIGALYAVAKPNERLLLPILHVVPENRRGSVRKLLEVLGQRLRGWVKGTLISMLAVGLLTTLGLSLLGVRYALLLGVTAGLLEIIPIVGPWVAGFIAVAVTILDDPMTAVWVALLMLGIQQLESNFITPLVMSKAAEVHPFITLFALFLFGSIFGFFGIILAVPLVLLVWTVVEVLWVERALGAPGPIEPVVEE